MEDLNRAVAARSDCGGRVRAVEAWSAANSARSSRVNYRVQHLSARRNYDWEAAEKAAITRHEESYERLTELLLAVCAEDGPEMARLADLDVDLRHTFHRIPQRDEHRSDARCVIMQEIRDRAVLAPTTLFGEITGDGSHHATLEPKGFICFVNGTEWNGGGATLTVACIDAARTKEQFMRAPEIGGGWRQEDVWQGRVEFLTQLFSTCFDDVSGFAYEGKPTRDSFRLSTAGSQPHVIGGSAGGEDGRYLVSVHRPR
ncbi:MAG: hypothetical protein CVU56_01865 [Deltaproteobacteria bacterium HGW-Deltaproteobacteria-14]|nr:MAG: hypothetical protein CVU56_01865 [Deltaproteobacteria bacterium HGW-Deltaproteobacteria-14]